MMMKRLLRTFYAALLLCWGMSASAATVPYTEHFTSNNALWEDTNNNPATWVASGGPDDSAYLSTTFNYFGFTSPFGGGPVTHRATGADGASFGSFIGDWLSEGVDELSLWVRHDAPEDLAFFMRVAGPANFPGAVIASPVSVTSNTWTQLSFDINPANPLCTPEGGTCASALATVFNLQFGTSAPVGLTDDNVDYNIDIDMVSIEPVPEPGTATLMMLGLMGLARAGRKR